MMKASLKRSMGLSALLLLLFCCGMSSALNLAPFFTADMNQHTLRENTPVGEVVYRLDGIDPEGSRVFFGVEGTDAFTVDRVTGEVRVAKAIDREVSSAEIRMTVVIEDEVGGDDDAPSAPGGSPNIVRVPISVIVLDENDNEPVFSGTPYETTVSEDTPVGTTVFRALEATDADLVGDVLEVRCESGGGGDDDACSYFEIVPRRDETDHDMFRGSLVLRRPLDYRRRQLLPLPLAVTDGAHTVRTQLTVTVADVQDRPPEFDGGSLTGVVAEDAPIGAEVLRVKARDGDAGSPRRILYSLDENPGGFFAIDADTGAITVDNKLDRESVAATSGVLKLKIRASELVNGIPGEDASTAATAEATVTVRDVNDEAPTFDRREYNVVIPENVPFGTPLANLDMQVRDTDTGPNASFKIELLDGGSGKFAVEPRRANGHTAVSLKVNSQDLDYENPNERKFLLLVSATETHTEEKLSSTATVTVVVADLNDNSPAFDQDAYTALVSESAAPGDEVAVVTARDRDGGDFGTRGIRYALHGSGAHLFRADPISGRISVAECRNEVEGEAPGGNGCLDFENTKAYFLTYSATDDNGEGRRSVASLRITVADANDNPPVFDRRQHSAAIDEGQTEFQPRLVVAASDADESSVLRYRIADGNLNDLFAIDQSTGEVSVAAAGGLRLDNIPTDRIRLTVEVSDGESVDNAVVDIAVKDVNDRSPVFEKRVYLSSVPENAPLGTPIENVMATDADFGVNAQIRYRIAQGAFDDFAVDPESGVVTVSGPLDFDRRSSYAIRVVAVDGGTPSLSGTASLTVSVMNKNDKVPAFLPATQRAQVSEDAPAGQEVLRLNASDKDLSAIADESVAGLVFSVVEPVYAVDADGAPVATNEFLSFFSLDEKTGVITVAPSADPSSERGALDRSAAAVVTLTIAATDMSADPPQHGYGTAVITIVDVNDFPPSFQAPWSPESPYITIEVPEEQANGTVVHKFEATDVDSNIDYFEIKPRNPFFTINRGTGELLVKSRLDFETLPEPRRITLDLVVHDAGVPSKSAAAIVVANVRNVNDETPVFKEESYEAEITEDSPYGTTVTQVEATDGDLGDFGVVRYHLSGTHASAFAVDPQDGTVTVADPAQLDRETIESLSLQVVAVDSAPPGSARSAAVPLRVTVLDRNDNQPRFLRREYSVRVIDNIPHFPDPSPIAQVAAADADAGRNAELRYSLVAGNEEGRFRVDPASGVIYPNSSFLGLSGRTFDLTAEVTDEAGAAVWPNPDRALVSVAVESVNTHKPEWFPPPPADQKLLVEEETALKDVVILKVNARDRDYGENGRISYYLKSENANVAEVGGHFSMNEATGELRARGTFDREARDKYELVLVARDHGTPVAFETLRFVTVVVTDVNDNRPVFPSDGGESSFTVPEEEEPGYLVGRVVATDDDHLKDGYGKVYYYIVEGNEERWFSIDKTYGNIYTKQKIDREQIDHFDLVVYASNDADLLCDGRMCDIELKEDDFATRRAVRVKILVEDKNDNLPRFESEEFFVGIPFDAKVGDLILDAAAFDPDLPSGGDGLGSGAQSSGLSYALRSSNLFRSGQTESSGSLVPSPFQMDPRTGRITLATLVAEFNQDKFVIDMEAKDSSSGHRAKARVHLWVYEPEQMVKLVVERPPAEVHNDFKSEILSELRNATGDYVALDDVRFHVDNESLRRGEGEAALRRDMTDVFVHAIDKESNTIRKPEEFLMRVDHSYDHLSVQYEKIGVSNIVPAAESAFGASPSSVNASGAALDANLTALVALLVILFFGVVLFSVLCCCMKGWVAKAPPADSKKGLLARPPPPGTVDGHHSIYGPVASPMAEDGAAISPTPAGGTDNPLWIDQKYKAYEEQELTMTVFSDQENSVISGAGNSSNGGNGAGGGPYGGGSVGRYSQGMLSPYGGGADTQSNAYATINKLPSAAAAPNSRQHQRGGLFPAATADAPPDYATLEKYVSSTAQRPPPGPVVPGVHSHSLPRPSGGGGGGGGGGLGAASRLNGGGSTLVINRNGEPELVADLM